MTRLIAGLDFHHQELTVGQCVLQSQQLQKGPGVFFVSLKMDANFVFRLFNVFLRFRGQSTKKACLRFAIFNFSEKLQNIFEIGLRKCALIIQKSLLKQNVF